jgi:hypothetical protein
LYIIFVFIAFFIASSEEKQQMAFLPDIVDFKGQLRPTTTVVRTNTYISDRTLHESLRNAFVLAYWTLFYSLYGNL